MWLIIFAFSATELVLGEVGGPLTYINKILPSYRFFIKIFIGRSANLPTICQMNIELHFPPTTFNESFERFFRNLETVIARGHALLHVDFFEPYSYLRAYFVNHVDNQCVQKFLCRKTRRRI